MCCGTADQPRAGSIRQGPAKCKGACDTPSYRSSPHTRFHSPRCVLRWESCTGSLRYQPSRNRPQSSQLDDVYSKIYYGMPYCGVQMFKMQAVRRLINNAWPTWWRCYTLLDSMSATWSEYEKRLWDQE
eukprot:2537681-Pyramimonas_sp.AAC.1